MTSTQPAVTAHDVALVLHDQVCDPDCRRSGHPSIDHLDAGAALLARYRITEHPKGEVS